LFRDGDGFAWIERRSVREPQLTELKKYAVFSKVTIAHRFKILSLVTYLAMGWLSLVVIYEMAVKLAAGSVTLLAVGGVVYSLGVIFYVCKRIPYNHAIWHGFVLGGSVCHFLAIYLYIGQA
ncbi:hemolysin III family protein, partial [Escherichia coli]